MDKQTTVRVLLFALVVTILLVIGLVVGLIVVATQKNISKDAAPVSQQQNPYTAQLSQDVNEAAILGKQLQQEISDNGLENMKRNLRNITHMVHVAGTVEEMAVLQYVKDTYKSYGLDVMTTDYDVLLSYPDYNNPNTVSMQHLNGSWSLVSTGLGDIPSGPPELVQQLKADKRALNWWNGYGANGTATGRLFYANYGRIADFQYFDNYNVSLKGGVVVVRYGKSFRGQKVQEAYKRGAIAVIIYSDPIDYGSPDLSKPNNTFPNSVYMPAGGAQRGTLLKKNGDPLTRLYPSKPYTYRSNISDVFNGVMAPKIPVMPIGYRDAVKLFHKMNGAVPNDWIGGMNVNYTLTSTTLFKVTVNAVTKPSQRIRNVIAFMRGSTEPDKYILLTNHVDAWTFGAMDPNSGTTAILEMARALTTVANATGWRPRRTIVFCSVDAEEYDLIGSTEFAEEYLKVLQQRAVALVNIDIADSGNVVFSVASTPSLYRALIRSAKLLPNPNDLEMSVGRKSIYDSWMFYFPPNGSFVPGQPEMDVPDTGSDDYVFMSFVGIPCADIGYVCDPTIQRWGRASTIHRRKLSPNIF